MEKNSGWKNISIASAIKITGCKKKNVNMKYKCIFIMKYSSIQK